jgi:hypothetical protein
MTGHRDTFRPEALPATIPASERGHFEAAPEPGRPGQVRLWLTGDGGSCMFPADVERGQAVSRITSTAVRL